MRINYVMSVNNIIVEELRKSKEVQLIFTPFNLTYNILENIIRV